MYNRKETEDIFKDNENVINLVSFESAYPGNVKSNIQIYELMKSRYNEFVDIDKKTFMALCKMYKEKHNLKDAYCKICGKLCNPKSDYTFYDACSKECGRIIASRKTVEKYYTKSKEEIASIKEKRATTNLKRFGSTTNLQSKEMIEKRIEKYGGNSNFYSKDIQEQIKQTNLKRYGVENVFSNDIIKEKIKKTNIKKYGKENPSQADKIKKKIKQTNIERYDGVFMGSEVIKKRTMENNLKRYGTFYPQRLKSTKEKVKQTNLERTGYGSPMQNPETKEKSIITCIEKYGVAYNCLRPECREASGHIISKLNLSWKKDLENIGYTVELEKVVSERYAFDLYIPEINTLIDISPTITHQSSMIIPTHFGNIRPKDQLSHINKLKIAEDNGHRCIMVWDWDDRNKILNCIRPKEKIYARKCSITSSCEKENIDNFLGENHLQGTCKGQEVMLALEYDGEIVEIMTFGKCRYNKNYQWELLRLCTKVGYTVVGGSERLFNFFIKQYKPDSIISYCDRAKFSGDVYTRLGFKEIGKRKPSKHWHNPLTGRHITNSLLLQRGFSQLHNDNNYKLANKGESNEELMFKYGYLEIYDCGQATFGMYLN